MPQIAFIGGGVMAEAMITAIIRNNVAAPADITVGEIDGARRDYLASTHGVRAVADNYDAVKIVSDGFAVIALKPQHLDALSDLKRGNFIPGPYLSIAAGARIETLRELTGCDQIVRVMPNTPAQIGHGMSVWTATPEVTQPQRDMARRVLGSMGSELEVHDERYIDMATALSGSGPGYVFLFLEAMIDAGVHVGLPRDQSRLLAEQTLLGAAFLASQSDLHAAELRNMVTSPGGTTAEGIAALEDGGLRAAVTAAVRAAYEKSRQLG